MEKEQAEKVESKLGEAYQILTSAIWDCPQTSQTRARIKTVLYRIEDVDPQNES